jgi:hypothetical protein
MGQFSIFGAIEEKERRGFWRAGTGAADAEECGVLLGMALFLLPLRRAGKFRGKERARISTAGAQEMQKQSGAWWIQFFVGADFLGTC